MKSRLLFFQRPRFFHDSLTNVCVQVGCHKSCVSVSMLWCHSCVNDWMIIQTKGRSGTSCAAALAASASVDVTADAEPHDPCSEQGDNTTEHNNQHLKEREESSHDADSNLCFDGMPEDNPEDEPEPWLDYMKRATSTDTFQFVHFVSCLTEFQLPLRYERKSCHWLNQNPCCGCTRHFIVPMMCELFLVLSLATDGLMACFLLLYFVK